MVASSGLSESGVQLSLLYETARLAWTLGYVSVHRPPGVPLSRGYQGEVQEQFFDEALRLLLQDPQLLQFGIINALYSSRELTYTYGRVGGHVSMYPKLCVGVSSRCSQPAVKATSHVPAGHVHGS